MVRRLTLLLCGLVPGFVASGAYGIRFDPGNPGAVAGTTFVPVNGQVFRLRQSDGAERFFVRDEEEPDLLHGEDPWLAELDGVRALVMTDPEFKGGQTGFMFLSGRLRKMMVDGTEYDIPPPGTNSISAVASLWPAADRRLLRSKAPDVWQDSGRIRLWYDNPNKAGVLFSELCVVGLALAFLRPLWCRILGSLATLAAFAGLVATSSRGALLALLCALAAAALSRFRVFFSKRVLIATAVAAAVAVGCVFALGQGERLTRNLLVEGQRETSRLTVWKTVPRMMADAPGGWGLGRSARAYADWYQERNECLLENLISGHLTLLVETGWGMRIGYVFLWAVLLIAAFVRSLKGASPLPLVALVTLAVAACFNPVLTVPELLVVPAVAALMTLAGFRRLAPGARKVVLLSSALIALGANAGVLTVGRLTSEGVSIDGSADGVRLNGAHPDVWIAHDDYVLHGGFWWMFGKEVRRCFRKSSDSPAIALTRGLEGVPAEVGTLVLVGETAADYLAAEKRPSAGRLVLVSPPFGWQSVPAELLRSGDVRMIVGGLALGGARADVPDWVTVVPGAELYVPGWLDLSVADFPAKTQRQKRR